MADERPGPADTVVLGGRVISVHPGTADDFEGVAVRDGRILRLLRRGDADAMIGPATEVHDLGDRPILPGFIDVHAHSEVLFRTTFATIDCRAPECGNVDDIRDALATGSRDFEKGEWIVGQVNLFYDRRL